MPEQLVIQFSTVAPCSFIPFTAGWPNRWSKAIRILGHTYFSHCDFLVSIDYMAQFLNCSRTELREKCHGCDYGLLGASYEPHAPVIVGNPSGVAYRMPDYQSFGIRRRMMIETTQVLPVLAWAHTQVGRPFDNSALSPKVFLADPFYGSVESRDWRDPSRWFCAEYLICALENGGFWGPGVKVPVMKNRITPADGTMILMMDPRLTNRATWLDPLVDTVMGPNEM